ncbi:hypothetical protein F8M41_009109 [Gigaspora margarita]|uniref:Uncharacterized protein n=1 Tax=Gigaspora margarita TaxID=4874 RepID=A0A8H4A251_GIGMA|nr:hypothetical protein F8M41_009109 [Gigaspora margarita]
MDAFLIETHKKSINNEIRRRNEEKKLLRELANQDDTSDYNSSTENSGDIKLTKNHLEDVKTVAKCHDQNDVISKVSVFDESDTTSEILESENQIVAGLVQKLASEFSSASLNEDEVDISETSEQDMVPGSVQSL